MLPKLPSLGHPYLGWSRVVVLLALLPGSIRPAMGQALEWRMVIGTDVACRSEPDRNSAVVSAWRPGDAFTVSATERDAVNDVWYRQGTGGLRSCWTFGLLTTAMESYRNPDAALMAVADHALGLEDGASFEHLVAVDNLLTERERRATRYFSAPEAVPPLLQLRHLQVLSRAARLAGGPAGIRRDPLRHAWILGTEEIRSYEPGGFDVSAGRYWDLYERHSGSPVADEIAWTAAQAPLYGDECYTECWLGFRMDPYLRYWSSLPDGDHLGEALETATLFAERASTYCVLTLWEPPRVDREITLDLVVGIRRSLMNVTAEETGTFMSRLEDVEQHCAANGAVGLDDPRSIPTLVRGLGTGFSRVARSLAAFGEAAAPAVLEVADPASARELDAVATALQALRFMVEGASDELSAATFAGMRRASERWLTSPVNTLATLSNAIDLAGVLDDPDLDELLETLASGPDEVIARGVDYPPSVERTVQRAADALARIPPLPRP